MRIPRLVDRSRQREHGGAVVEFALVGTLLLLLVGLIVQGALVFSAWLIITNAVREAARAGAICYQRGIDGWSCDLPDIEAMVVQAAGAVDESSLTVGASVSGDLLTVSATYPVPLVAPFAELIMPDPMPVSAESTMRLEVFGAAGLPTAEPVPTNTPAPTNTPVPTATETPIGWNPTATATPTETPIPTSTATPTPCSPPTSARCRTPTPTGTPTVTRTPTGTPTITPTPTVTRTPTLTPTPCPTGTPPGQCKKG